MAKTLEAQFFLLLLVVLCGSVTCTLPTSQEDALKAMADAFIGLAAHSWSSTDASNACTWDGVTCENGNTVTAIDLHGIALSGSLPADIKNLTGLITFDLSNCGLIGPLPDLSQWTALTHLNLSSNTLTSTISTLSSLTSLVVIDLSSNTFSGSLFDLTSFSALTKFSIRNNQFDLCSVQPHFGVGVTCDVRGQSGDECSCISSYSQCTTDLCAPTSAPSAPAAPISPPVAPVSPPVAPVSPPIAPVSPPTAPVSPPVAPVAPPTAPVSPPTAPISPPVAPVAPPQAPQAPPTAPVSPPVATPEAAPELAPQISPNTPESSPTVETPTESPVTNTSEPVEDPTVGSILPYGLCVEQTSTSGAYYFSYASTWPVDVTIPLGPKNTFTPAVSSGVFATVFRPGNHSAVVRIDGFYPALKWTLNGYSVTISVSATAAPLCYPVPSSITLHFDGVVNSVPAAQATITSYITSLMSMNNSRISVGVTTSSKRVAGFDATVVILPPSALLEISSMGILNAIQANLSVSSSVMANAISGTGISFVGTSGSDPLSRIDPTADPVVVPTDETSHPFNYKTFTGAQKAGVAIAAIFGVALLVAVGVGLWWVSRPSRQGSSALTASNGANSSARGESGNTSKDTQANEASSDSKDGTSDDEDEDDEDDSEVAGTEEVSEEEDDEEEDEDDDDGEEESEEEESEEEDSEEESSEEESSSSSSRSS